MVSLPPNPFACPQTSRRLPPPLAYRERRGAAFCNARFARYAAFCNARFLARFARYAAFCIARFLARCMSSGHSARPLCLPSDFLRLRSGLPTESSMNGTARPCENSTTDIANTANRLFFCTRHVLAPVSRESFSAGLCRAKTTETCAKWCPCPKSLSGYPHLLPTESAVARLFVTLAS